MFLIREEDGKTPTTYIVSGLRSCAWRFVPRLGLAGAYSPSHLSLPGVAAIALTEEKARMAILDVRSGS